MLGWIKQGGGPGSSAGLVFAPCDLDTELYLCGLFCTTFSVVVVVVAAAAAVTCCWKPVL